jgi:hypothetical protein
VIPPNLLAATDSRAPGICVYGGAGLKKTNAIATLPPPVRIFDVGEGGTASVLPWVSRRREADSSGWTVYSQEQREYFLSLLDEETAANRALKTAAPYIDIVHYDVTDYNAYDQIATDLANLDLGFYNSVAIDSLQELAISTQTKARGKGGYDLLMNEVNWSWAGAQERAQKSLRKLRNYRDQGLFVYLIGGEEIAKDYVKNPMEKRAQGEPAPEPYSIRGTVGLPGQLSNAIAHIPDILCHAKLMNGKPWWVCEAEMLPGGGAHWDGKDRYGRLSKYEPPNIRHICKKLYGEEGMKAIYEYALGGIAA